MESLHFVFIFANHLLYCRETFLAVGMSKSRNNTLVKKDFIRLSWLSPSISPSLFRPHSAVRIAAFSFVFVHSCMPVDRRQCSPARPGLQCLSVFADGPRHFMRAFARSGARGGEKRERERGHYGALFPSSSSAHPWEPFVSSLPSSLFPRRFFRDESARL